MENKVDLFIIGGGINGTAIAADAAGRGLSVALCEKSDLAAGTSSASTKLIHGGLRYLEFFEFNMVRKALHEREILMRRAPHLISPLQFILPHEKHLRPAWFIRLGLYLYDHLSKRNYLPSSKMLDLEKDSAGKPLNKNFQKGFSYYDCFTDDARLVVLNALSAKEHGATILTRTEFISAKRNEKHWEIKLKDLHTQQEIFYQAKALVNSTGPWINQVQKNITDPITTFNVKLDKGSHIVIPKLYEGNFAYILQNSDNRIVFIIPYQNDFTLVGTTDVSFIGNLENINIIPSEINYLCDIVNRHFQKKISPEEVYWSYSGVRCLHNTYHTSVEKLSRDYKLDLEIHNQLPLLSVIGGKLTTHRLLAEDALDKLRSFFPQMKSAWTATQPLPGGELNAADFDSFLEIFKNDFPWLPEKLAQHYARNYGTYAYKFLTNKHSIKDLGKNVSAGLYECEIDYLIQHEWAQTAEDILWRRTKFGLHFSPDNIRQLSEYLK